MKFYLPLALLVAMLGGTVFAQTANVIELEPTDALRAKKAWDALQKAQGEWDTVRSAVGQKYAERPSDSVGSGHCWITLNDGQLHCWHEQFENGFEFSKDFKFIVPKSGSSATISGTITNPPSCGGNSCWCYNTNCITPNGGGISIQ